MGFFYTSAIKKLRKLKKRIKIVRGGTSAGKTFGIIPILIDKAARYPNLEISIVSETIPHLRRGAIKDFLKIMQVTNRYIDSNWNKSLLTYKFASGSYIEFFSADQSDKLRGARRTHLYINECNNVSFEAYQQLSIRTSEEIWLDYNPVELFWVDTEIVSDNDSELIVLTYKDNEALDTSIVREIEKARDKAETSDYWANWWRVYGLGEVGKVDGLIFTNWGIVKEIPSDAVYVGSGLDFGFTNDPTALIDVYKHNGELYVNQSLYERMLTNPMIAAHINSNSLYRQKQIIADSSEPKSISELQALNVRVLGATKGQGSVNHGIDILQRYQINITETSLDLIKEFRSYKWEKDKAGKSTNTPIDFNNHACDALRYAALHYLNTNGGLRPFGAF